MEYLAENSGSPWTTHIGRVTWSSRTGSSISSHHQPCRQGAIEGDHTGWIEFSWVQREEITHAGRIKVLSRISRMPHHIPYPQSRRPSFAHLAILCGREDWPKMFSASVVHGILPPENNASKSPCRCRVFSYPCRHYYRGGVQTRNIWRPSPLLWYDRVSRPRHPAHPHDGMIPAGVFKLTWN